MRLNITHKNDSGFTLIEVIIAMTILSLILVLLFSTLFTANRSWQSTERKISQNDELRLVGYFIQRQLSQNVPLMWVSKEERRLIFEGKSNELRFTSSLPAHRGGGGIQIITLKVNQTDNASHLDLHYRNANTDSSPFKDHETDEKTTLLENIDAIELSYFGSDKIDEDPVWRDEWQNDELLPIMISLKVYISDKSQHWPEIKIPLHSNFIKGQPQYVLNGIKRTTI
ncbi:MAG: prepilin-type N-terminal cleavage/methylation domain-containing protein [Proteobacteria bacterium]|nr:prepilin-type N-terminal cleavage/methylation domain-containing protein [Pseudomonadota bacterium]NOG58874.1 prepilin-type N-terminal cleavage/methylation domain-containing protein [Pseudomonadota bacterium]